MASVSVASRYSASSWPPKTNNSRAVVSSFTKIPFGKKTQYFSLSPSSNPTSKRRRLSFSMKNDEENEPSSSSSSAVVISEKPSDDSDTQKSKLPAEEVETSKESGSESEEKEKQQEMDWKTDEEFKKFMGNPSIEAAIKLEKKRADRKLKDLDRESSGNPLVGLFNKFLRDSLTREKERLEKAEEAFKAIDLNKLKSCFGFDSFFPTDVRRFGDGGIFVGNLRRPIEEVMPKLEQKCV
ncbi:putative zinc metallopeptidase EGY3 chloroplastic isoform X2 [Prunus yedoensis var. nudiflora]|uniref:Putative zinc metallopeptidase EGY3 chloroplastic isoform X2 n=1 Tax=Prunus yedoensis var. nudiflora TaxID=2094558 RepID=A0A314ZUK9_PRUYE|nr:putative zinc metallopeptidase EGY3 chloroplastic isoform X2 [Prunus yedoensis var. nudiflora]